MGGAAEFDAKFKKIAAAPAARCAFALCETCHYAYSVQEEHPSRDTVLEMEGGNPGLITSPICRLCPSVGNCLCPAHADYCILGCASCGDARCVEKSHFCSKAHAWVETCVICYNGACPGVVVL